MTDSEIKIYQSDDGITKIDVKFDHDTVWLSQKQMALLFDKDSDTIGLHIRNIYLSKELDENSTTEFFSVVQIEGKRQVKRKLKLYNLDTIISVGYRVNSKRGIQFRILDRNGLLYNEYESKRIADNTLVALTLMIAVSKPEEKETMIKVIVNLINRKN